MCFRWGPITLSFLPSPTLAFKWLLLVADGTALCIVPVFALRYVLSLCLHCTMYCPCVCTALCIVPVFALRYVLPLCLHCTMYCPCVCTALCIVPVFALRYVLSLCLNCALHCLCDCPRASHTLSHHRC